MVILKYIKLISLFLLVCWQAVAIEARMNEARIKDISSLADARSNQLSGYGIVIGLRRTGDTAKSIFTKEAIANVLKNLDVNAKADDIKSNNIASVIVTCELPAFIKSGSRVDVAISSIGDATSLRGGVLLATQLKGSDGQVYAVAQGSISVGGVDVDADKSYLIQNSTNSGRISNGAIVEREVAVNLIEKNYLTFNLHNPDFVTAARMKIAIETAGLGFCEMFDPSSVKVIMTPANRSDLITYISRLEQLKVIPDTIAKIVIDERTGTVVIGEKVTISPIAITHGSINIKVEKDMYDVSQIRIDENQTGFKILQQGNVLRNLVNSLNALGTKPSDIITILQAIKAAGAISAPIEVI